MLAAEPFDERGFARVFREQGLQRDGPIEQPIMGQIHLGHPALGQFALDFVAVGKDPSDE